MLLIVAVAASLSGLGFIAFRMLGTPHCDAYGLLRVQLETNAFAIEAYRSDNHVYPPSLEALCESGPAGLGPYLRARSLKDPWGNALFYRVDGDGRGFVVFSLGRDGRMGGRGVDTDISESVRLPVKR